ncbi:MAG: ribosome maturation factor RimP [Lachnospiraceae bacterium]|nr:ribosome maturation factor RimP [Lachnospiraceae bacterium]
MKKKEIEEYCEQLVTPILEANNLKLWDVEYVKEGQDYYLRVFADKEEGITIDDCVTVSRALEAKLDEEDKLKDAYILEVSSPGLTRQLKSERDFANSIGRQVDVKLYKAIDKYGKEFSGILEAADENSVSVTFENEALEKLDIDKNNIATIRLSFIEG